MDRSTKKYIVVAVLSVFVVSIGIVGWGVYRLFYWPINKLERRVAYVDHLDHLRIADLDGSERGHQLPSINGEPAYGIIFTVTSSGLYYWSAGGSALCTITMEDESPAWHLVPDEFDATDWTVHRISTDGRYVFLDMIGPRAVMLLNLDDSRWRLIEDISEVRIDPHGSGRIVVRTGDDGFRLSHVSDIEDGVHLSQADGFVDWDYDFDGDTLYLLNWDHLEVISGIGATERIDMPWVGWRLFFQPDLGEVWVPGHGVSTQYRLPVFSRSGEFVGDIGFISCFGSPRAISSDVAGLIDKHLPLVPN